MSSRRFRLSWSHIGLIFAAWAILGAVAVGNSLLSHQAAACDVEGAAAGPFDTLPSLAMNSLPPYLFWAVLSPLVVVLARRWRLENLRDWNVLGLHAGALALAVALSALYKSLAHNLLQHTIALRPDPRWHLDVALARDQLHAGLVLDVSTYLSILALAAAWIYYRDARERSTEAARLQTRLADARYETLRAKVEPHFLFNTLNTISALAATDPGATRDTVASLSTLLRRALDHGSITEVPLSEELAFSQHYLEIEKRRYGDRLHVEFAIAADTRHLLVPSFLLQPLLENAIRHGTAARRGRSTIRVEVARQGEGVAIRVRDDGPGAPGPIEPGIGISSTAARLEELYGAEATLQAHNRWGGGFEAAITLPLRGDAPHPARDEATHAASSRTPDESPAAS